MLNMLITCVKTCYDMVWFLFNLAVDGPLGKRMNCDKTRARIEWQPKFKSFAEFLGVTEE